MGNIFAILFTLVIGGMALKVGLKALRVRRQVNRWPTVPGTLVDRAVVVSTAGSVSTSGTRHRATVRYTYVVDGRQFTGDRILPWGSFTGSREAMQKALDALGQQVEVRYDPENPANACLKNMPTAWGPGALAAAALCFLTGLVLLMTG